MKNITIIIVIMVAQAFAVATLYDVELSYNDNFTAREASQSFLAIADSISVVSFFCGSKVIPGQYVFSIKDSLGGDLPGNPTAFSDSAGLFQHELVFATFNPNVYVRKGFKYRLHIRHSLPDQYHTNFYYNRDNSYPDGELIGHAGWDLATRIKDVNDFPKDLFGMNSHLLNTWRSYPDSFQYMDKWEACIDSMKAMGVTWDDEVICPRFDKRTLVFHDEHQVGRK
jgi:hypothetical protein